MRLFGRRAECASLDRIVSGTRSGRSAALVLRGEPGSGKTALLSYAVRTAPDSLRIAGVESESAFPFAALHRLLVPMLPARDRLPASQASALEIACGLADGPPADRFLVSLAALSLLAAATDGKPLLICVDDAQWLDDESIRALAFVARRLHAEGIALLFGMRTSEPDPGRLDGLPVLKVAGLDADAGVALLTEVVDGPLDRRTAERIVAATGGNPLALTDLGRELTGEQWRGGTPLPEPAPIGSRLEAHYLARVRAYPPDTQTWLLLAAADPTGDHHLLAAAARELGITAEDAGPAEAGGLVAATPDVAFRHPLVRSAIYGAAAPPRRRRVHRALAAVTTAPGDADRRAWHLAGATAEPDESVAAELERGADRAGARGGQTARAAFLARAAGLTSDPVRRAGRLLAAASAALSAGAAVQATTLLDGIDEGVLDDAGRGSMLMFRSAAGVSSGDGGANRDAGAHCLAAAEAFDDPERARDAVLQAAEYAISAESMIRGTTPETIGDAATRWSAPGSTTLADLLLAGWTTFWRDGYPAAVGPLRRALAALSDPATADAEVLKRVVMGASYGMWIWEDGPRDVILRRAEAYARRTGALFALDLVHYVAVMSDVTLGRLTDAARHDSAGWRLRQAIGITAAQEPVWRHPELVAARGAVDAAATVEAALPMFEHLGFGGVISVANQSLGVADIGRGDYAGACERLLPLVEIGRPRLYSRVLPDLVEAAVRAGDRGLAAGALADLEVAATASGTPWALGVLERGRALLAPGDSADAHYRAAADHLGRTRSVGDLARARLLHGEWLRRRRRRREARERLGAALAAFTAEGAESFAERARQELLATGGTVRDRVPDDGVDLTPQEAAVARMARDGATNAEIAANLYLSVNTVDYHLRKVFRKAGVTSRRQLKAALPE